MAGGVHTVFLPEIADYELRRKLIHLQRSRRALTNRVNRLDDLARHFTYLSLDTTTMQLAALLWAEARYLGFPTAAEASLDGDVILAAQAIQSRGTIITTNRKHLARFVETKTLDEIFP